MTPGARCARPPRSARGPCTVQCQRCGRQVCSLGFYKCTFLWVGEGGGWSTVFFAVAGWGGGGLAAAYSCMAACLCFQDMLPSPVPEPGPFSSVSLVVRISLLSVAFEDQPTGASFPQENHAASIVNLHQIMPEVL